MANSKVKLQPLGKRVVVKPQQEDDKTTGGLIIPPSAQDDQKPEVGEVVKLGTGEKDFTFSVSEGDTVFFSSHFPDKIEVDDVEYYILSEDNILAILK